MDGYKTMKRSECFALRRYLRKSREWLYELIENPMTMTDVVIDAYRAVEAIEWYLEDDTPENREAVDECMKPVLEMLGQFKEVQNLVLLTDRIRMYHERYDEKEAI